MLRKLIALPVCAVIGLCFTGCSSVKTSDTARTAKEQLLVSSSIDRALNRISFQPMSGAKVFVEEKYLDSVDSKYLLGSIRHRLLRERAQLVGKPEDADVILEVRSGGVGTDNAETFIGIPEITLPGMLTLPELRLANRSTQQAYAKLGLVALDAKTGAVLGDGGVASALSDDNNWFVMGVGPFQNGTLKNEVNQAKRRAAGTPHRPLPAVVAFNAPARSASDDPQSEFEFASGTRELSE